MERGNRRSTGPLATALLTLLALAAPMLAVLGAPTPGRASIAGAATPLSISIDGNHFVNGAGQTVRLLGVDVPGTEYACEEGWGDSSLPISLAHAQAIAGWHATAVRVPLNEDCWLGINGQPAYGTQAGYQAAIESWVSDLNQAGLYVVLDLHWSAPGTNVANGQRPMPDNHSAAFWSSVATAFKSNPAVVFDAFNEPYSPSEYTGSTLGVSWSCWRNGGCTLPVAADGTTPDDSDTYTAVGMQALVTAIRDTGAAQPIMLGGLAYANDLSGWLANEPSDPDHALAASFHDYYGNACDTASCWSSTVVPVSAQVPVVTGEFDQGYDCADPPTTPSAMATFDDTYMDWADAHGVSYLAWGWWVLGDTSETCSSLGGGGSNYDLVSDDSGTPVAPDGTDLYDHLASLVSTAVATTTTLTASTLSVGAGAAVKLTARVTTTGGAGDTTPSGTVTFSTDGAALHAAVTVTKGTAALTTKELPVGTDTVTAAFAPTSGSSETASTGTQVVAVSGSAPVVTAIKPTSGPVAGATSVTITGTGFFGIHAVSFGTTPATSYRVNATGTTVTAVAPTHAPGVVGVSVVAPIGASTSSTADELTYEPPTVTKVAPASGAAGRQVTITGKNFVGVTGVIFGTTQATGFTVGSKTKIVVDAPAGSGTLDVQVATAEATSVTSAADRFTYT